MVKYKEATLSFRLERPSMATCPATLLCMLKVRQSRNDFFMPTILPKNERSNSTLLIVNLFCFLKEGEDTKKTFRN